MAGGARYPAGARLRASQRGKTGTAAPTPTAAAGLRPRPARPNGAYSPTAPIHFLSKWPTGVGRAGSRLARA
jgi:hypothetical protein